MAYDPTYLSGPHYIAGRQGRKLYFLDTADGSAAISGAAYVTNAAAPAAGHFNMQAGDIVIVTQRASLPTGTPSGSDTYVCTTVSTAGAATIVKTSTT